MQWRRTKIPAHERNGFQRVRSVVGGAWDVLAWTYLALVAVVGLSRAIGGRAPSVLQALQAGFPLLAVGLPVVLLLGLGTRRWLQVGVAALLAISSWLAVRPAIGRSAAPFWAEKGAKFRVTAANVFFKNRRLDEAAKTLLAQNADVVAVSELTDGFVAAAVTAGFEDAYPYRLLDPQRDYGESSPVGGLGLYSKYPIDDVIRMGPDRAPYVRLVLSNGVALRLGAVHIQSPVNAKAVGAWTSDLARLGRLLDAAEEPVVFVGDFNAARWQPPFGALFARGLRDAHETVGKGLSRSWPTGFPLFRLDHALSTRQVFAMAVDDLDIPGSDHRGFTVDFSIQLKQAAPPTTTKPRKSGPRTSSAAGSTSA